MTRMNNKTSPLQLKMKMEKSLINMDGVLYAERELIYYMAILKILCVLTDVDKFTIKI